MSFLVMLFAVTVGAAIQAAVPALAWAGYSPLPVLLGIVLYYALLRDRVLMVTCAIVAGLLEDSLSLSPLGFTSFAYCLAGWIAHSFRDTVLVRQATTHVLFGAAANAGTTVLLFLLLFKDGLVRIGLFWFMAKLVGTLALGGLVAPLAVLLMTRFDHMLGNLEESEA